MRMDFFRANRRWTSFFHLPPDRQPFKRGIFLLFGGLWCEHPYRRPTWANIKKHLLPPSRVEDAIIYEVILHSLLYCFGADEALHRHIPFESRCNFVVYNIVLFANFATMRTKFRFCAPPRRLSSQLYLWGPLILNFVMELPVLVHSNHTFVK